MELVSDLGHGANGGRDNEHRRRTVAAVSHLVAVIEDDEEIASNVEELLRDECHRTVWYKNGADALSAFDAGAEIPSVFLLDLRMPTMDGWTFRVKQRKHAAICDVPVVVMSADSSPQAAAIDADAFLPKPLNADRLLRTIEEAELIWERRRLMATSLELERLRSLGMLVGTIAHELNNPLQCVSGNLELLERQCDQLGTAVAGMRPWLAALRVGTDAITSIVKELRTFSRAESADERSADVVRALEAAVRLGEHAVRHNAIIVRHFQHGMPPVVGNEAKLSQVFLNLLINAAQAMKNQAIDDSTIELTASSENGRVVVEVSDTGIGMPPHVLARVFDPFFTTKTANEGTGIGLSFSKQIVEACGGHISVRSTPSEGSTFRVELVPSLKD